MAVVRALEWSSYAWLGLGQHVMRNLTHGQGWSYQARMQIDSIRHKALRRFAESGSPKGLPSDSVARLRNMLGYLAAIEAEEELRVPPNFRAHKLTGDREGIWALTVTRNWRMTFRINAAGAIEDMDLEDYH